MEVNNQGFRTVRVGNKVIAANGVDPLKSWDLTTDKIHKFRVKRSFSERLPVVVQKLLFKLHLRNTYPFWLTSPDGFRIPANMIRLSHEAALTSTPILPDAKS